MTNLQKLINQIDNVLPQTQCGECQYSGCLPYAEAMAAGKDTPNHCPPGGLPTLQKLGEILGIDTSHYEEQVKKDTRPLQIAVIDEDNCIGCTKCIQACPIDAIVGSAKNMHVILTDECTGCELCISPCPVDCIDLIPTEHQRYQPHHARQRYQNRLTRLSEDKVKKPKKLTTQDKQDYINQARERIKNKKSQGKPS